MLRSEGYTPYRDAFVNPASPSSIGFGLFGYLGGTLSASVAMVANLAYYVPFTIERPVIVYQVAWHNGATSVTGTHEVGIYDANGNKIVSGSAAGSGLSVMQFVDTTDTTLNPGLYWMAFSNTSAAGNLYMWSPAAPIAAMLGVLTEASANPLPATATMALNHTNAQIPLFGLQMRTVA